MKIQYNTDNNIEGAERHESFFSEQINKELKRFESYITRIEVHLSDENHKKGDLKIVKCQLEGRLEGQTPISVSNEADSSKRAVSGAIDKLKTSLDTILGRLANH
jgi:ribosome-associated translation inhibitor RaiA